MAAVSDHKNRSISIRVSKKNLAMIDRAVLLQGSSRSDFVRQAAVTAALDTLLEQPTVCMTHEGFEDFLEALARPPEAVPLLAEALHHAPPWDTEKRP